MLDMFHMNEIARAIRLLCQSGVALAADCIESDTVAVGSNALFEVGQLVELLDEDSTPEQAEVQQKLGLNTIVLSAPVSGSFTVAKEAWVRLATPRLPGLKFVAQGPPELLPEPRGEQFPCLVVQPAEMRQTPESTNRSFDQEYDFRVFYARKRRPGEPASEPVLEDAAALCNVLMEDTYLGGTCWSSHVTAINPEDPYQAALRERGVPVAVVRVDVTARRRELWAK